MWKLTNLLTLASIAVLCLALPQDRTNTNILQVKSTIPRESFQPRQWSGGIVYEDPADGESADSPAKPRQWTGRMV